MACRGARDAEACREREEHGMAGSSWLQRDGSGGGGAPAAAGGRWAVYLRRSGGAAPAAAERHTPATPRRAGAAPLAAAPTTGSLLPAAGPRQAHDRGEEGLEIERAEHGRRGSV